MDISKLYFGKDDAERDYTSNGLLKDGFLKTVMYDEARKGKKSLVIGRKGAGKSAICLMLHNNFCKELNSYSCIITPDAISADEIRRFELLGVNEEQAKKLVWRYILLVQISKFVLEISKSNNSSNPKTDKIRDFLIQNEEITNLTFQEKFWKIINRIKASVKLSAFGQEVEIESNKGPNEGVKLESKMDFLEKYLVEQMNACKDYRLYLLIDKVDEIWNNDSWSDLMVISLLMAIKEINEKFSNVSCIVFLRKDIYDLLKFDDRDKFRGDEIHISWTEENLEKLVVLRAMASLNQNFNEREFWEKFFPQKVNNTPIISFLLSKTLKRPRDIIQFCNLCRDNAILSENKTITESNVLKASDIYSNWKLNDLIVEWKVNYPFLNDLFIIFSNASYIIYRNRFSKLFEQIKPALESRYKEYASSFTEDSVVNILYSIGFLGIERNGMNCYYFEDPRTVEFKDKVFIVHPAFRDALRSTSSINLKPFEANPSEEYYLSEVYRQRSASRQLLESTRTVTTKTEHISRKVQNLLHTIKKENIPGDIKAEIEESINHFITEISPLNLPAEIVSFQVIIAGFHRFIENLYTRLKESEILVPQSAMDYELENTSRSLLEFLSADRMKYLF